VAKKQHPKPDHADEPSVRLLHLDEHITLLDALDHKAVFDAP
jgi:hypothetical protein